ncbi:MAG: hypothetical protein AB7E95_12120, partial [Kiritimatiellales bacterium]
MKRCIQWIIMFFCGLGVVNASATGLNEWTFNKDVAGLTLSQATNSGPQFAVFSTGGDGFLDSDGMGQ